MYNTFYSKKQLLSVGVVLNCVFNYPQSESQILTDLADDADLESRIAADGHGFHG